MLNILIKNPFSFILPARPHQDDLRLSGPPPGQAPVAGARTRDRRIPLDLGANLLSIVPPMRPLLIE
ncbi:hypothetical protein PoB_007342700 [Plakobranchus ocellatus]|uniref:Uncharacterized protein n=1 Tax=Plakobranchus ocellatus TaxID=259542 RepID=A0AAV4DRI3_9GAST|nr:hypothetical protein PoB_007342700 [Plakobranchus ocellatus]